MPLDAALWYGKNKKAYFFSGKNYVRFNPKTNKVDEGYPKKTKSHWSGMPFNKIDAVLWHEKKKRVYFFSGANYVRFNPDTNKVDPGYPKKTKDHWHGMPFNKIDAVLWYRNKAYFFSGKKYARYNPTTNKVDAGYPKKTKDHWKGMPFDKIDAALWHDKKKKAYFFSGDEYVRYNSTANKVDAGYPKNTIEYWYGLPGEDGIYLTSSHVQDIIKTKLKNKLKSNCKIRLADGKFFCPTVADANVIIQSSQVDQRVWISERFDCDDFALLLKAEFVKDAYRQGDRRSAHCFGIVWGSLPGPHAINWMINADMKLRFIEPQQDTVYFPKSTDKDIYFMLS